MSSLWDEFQISIHHLDEQKKFKKDGASREGETGPDKCRDEVRSEI